MTGYALRFYRDVFPAGAGPVTLPAGARTIYVRTGDARVDSAQLAADDACFRDRETEIAVGAAATLWRCEFAPRDAPPVLPSGIASTLLLESELTMLPSDGGLMMRCDSVAFPPGGCAYTHTHKGPGIRCLEKGAIRIDSDGHSNQFAVEQPWFEAGPVPVFAQADAERETRFIRVSILPRALEGKSSITYVNPEDQDKPKLQTYRGYFDEFVEG
ncbi:MAG: hypothetical protein GKS00_27765 [Alphaproteobacteria bacterium]|nr:hypothetical protein [Alphaproteobacteria bacterium]